MSIERDAICSDSTWGSVPGTALHDLDVVEGLERLHDGLVAGLVLTNLDTMSLFLGRDYPSTSPS